MPLVISGKLSLPVTGQPASNAEVRFRAVNSVGEIIQGAESIARCDAQGNYTISIEFARYELSTKISTVDFVVHGLVTIDVETVASDLEDLIFLIGLSSDATLTDELLKQFLAIKVETEQAAAEAKDSAKIASDAEAAITPMYNYFNANYPTFETNYADFASKYPDVVAKHGEVVTLAGQAEDSATLALNWAVGPSGSSKTPSDTNNSWYWAEQAKYNANLTFISGGLFAPATGAEYPDVSGVVRDTIWIVEFANHGDQFTFTTGDLIGEIAGNADMMFYDTPTNKWSLLKTSVSAGILSIDGNTGPNVNLESKYYWANNKPSIGDVDNLQVELNKKANSVDVDTALSLKADKSAVDNIQSELSNKANTDDVNAELALKADKSYVDEYPKDWVVIGSAGSPPFIGDKNSGESDIGCRYRLVDKNNIEVIGIIRGTFLTGKAEEIFKFPADVLSRIPQKNQYGPAAAGGSSVSYSKLDSTGFFTVTSQDALSYFTIVNHKIVLNDQV